MKYFRKLIGEKCYLSPMNIEDASKFAKWRNDFETAVYLGCVEYLESTASMENWISDINKYDPVRFTIMDKETDESIGICALMMDNKIQRLAHFGIEIGEKDYWNMGYGTDATKLTLDFGFNVLNLKNIMLEVCEYNQRAIKSYEKCGFKVIGKRRKCYFIGGKYYDDIHMDILPEEFKSIYVKNQFKNMEK